MQMRFIPNIVIKMGIQIKMNITNTNQCNTGSGGVEEGVLASEVDLLDNIKSATLIILDNIKSTTIIISRSWYVFKMIFQHHPIIDARTDAVKKCRLYRCHCL